MTKYKKRYDPDLYAPFQVIVDRAVLLGEGGSFEVSVKGVSASMVEYRLRSLFEHMRERGDFLGDKVTVRRVEGGVRVRRKEGVGEIKVDFFGEG